MSLGNQLRELQTATSAFRQELFGTNEQGQKVKFSYDRGRAAPEGYYNFAKRRYLTEEQGIREEQGVIIRWLKAGNVVPELQKEITFKDASGEELNVVIEDRLGTHVASVEWVLGCRLL